MYQRRHTSRRQFIRKAVGTAVSLPLFVPSTVLGANTPGNRITIGCIGVGRMGLGDLRGVLQFDEVQVVAVCDVDSKRAAYARKLTNDYYAKKRNTPAYHGCDAYGNFRELIGREDIDAVLICTPDHWHAIGAIEAARAGKDIFLQKPMTLTLPEGRTLSNTARRYGTVFQVGSQQRSENNFRFACELVRNERIGKLKTITIAVGLDISTGTEPVMPVPGNLDYAMWLGPAPWSPYTEKRVHPQNGYSRPGWLRIRDYCLGMVTGWGSHHLDIAQWAMGTEHSGPSRIVANATFPTDGLWDVHTQFDIQYHYANGVEMTFTGNNVNKQGVLFEGTEGWVYVRRGFIDAFPKSLLTRRIKPDETHLYRSYDHKKNFIECIKTRRQTVAPVEVGHRSCSVGILGDIAMRTGQTLEWDPTKERFTNSEAANRMLWRPTRSPWML